MCDKLMECEGYKKLLKSVEHDESEAPGFHDYREKLQWIIARVKSYADATGLDVCDLLNTWESNRNYWYMNYYQESNHPKIEGGSKVRIFDTVNDFKKSVGHKGFRCPACSGVSTDPNECDTNIVLKLESGEGPCNWKSYGFFGTMTKGAKVFVKDTMKVHEIFMPVAWEDAMEVQPVPE